MNFMNNAGRWNLLLLLPSQCQVNTSIVHLIRRVRIGIGVMSGPRVGFPAARDNES